MPSEQKEVVRRLFEEFWNRGKRAIADDVFAASCTHHDPNTPEIRKARRARSRFSTFILRHSPTGDSRSSK